MEKIDPVAKSMTQTVQHDTTTTYQCHCQFPLDSPPVFTCGGASLHIQLNTDFFLGFIVQKSTSLFQSISLSSLACEHAYETLLITFIVLGV